ncbi:transposase, partial [Pelagicoccus sp. SDUM812003]|uniref:IS110 family transposase n=1 Tax=Pelagicoccus sp. SDUM812003 TaxID=3041267 RepID=UPI00280EFD6D
MNTATTTHTIGLDLSDRKVAVCVVDAKGKIIEERSMPNEPGSYKLLARTYPGSTTVLETGSHSPWVSRLLAAEGLKPIVANARKLRSIYQNDRKSDRNDARMLAKLGRVDPTLLHPVRHRSEGAQRDLVRIKTRDALVSARVDMMNSVRFLLKGLGVRVPSGVNATCFVRRTRAAVDAEHCDLVEPLLASIDDLTDKIKKHERLLRKLAEEKYPAT